MENAKQTLNWINKKRFQKGMEEIKINSHVCKLIDTSTKENTLRLLKHQINLRIEDYKNGNLSKSDLKYLLSDEYLTQMFDVETSTVIKVKEQLNLSKQK